MSYKFIIFLKEWINYIILFIKTFLMTDASKNLEILALRSQLALLTEQTQNKKIKKPKTTLAFRQLWVFISKLCPNWKTHLTVVKPTTVVGWHRTAFKLYWKQKSKKLGRPPLSKDIIDLIKQIHKENPILSPEKINELLVSMGITNAPAPNTIAKYIPSTRKPPSQKQVQSWKTFLKNNIQNIWAMDYFVVPTLFFKPLYVLVIINHGTRKIEHLGVTAYPNLAWLKQQIRNATPYDHKPKYLIHDNDTLFVSPAFQSFLSSINIISKRTAIHSPWQNGICERCHKTLRQELTNHIIPINEVHLRRLLKDYVNNYYNTHRPHQGLNGKTPIPLPKYESTKLPQVHLKVTPVLNGMYHTYEPTYKNVA